MSEDLDQEQGVGFDYPTADAVAAAVVAAARVTGEDPLTVFDSGPRCKLPAFEALTIIYPDAPVSHLARMVGINTNPMGRLKQGKTRSWWPEDGAPALDAALEALETL